MITAKAQGEGTGEELFVTADIIFEAMIDGVGIIDINGILVQGNTALAKMHGYESIDAMIGKCVTTWTKQEDIPRIMPAVRECWEKGVIQNIEITHITKQGKEILLSLNAVALKNETAKVIGAVVVIREITERKKAKEELEQRMAELEQFSKVAVGRELKMAKMEKELTALRKEIGDARKAS